MREKRIYNALLEFSKGLTIKDLREENREHLLKQVAALTVVAQFDARTLQIYNLLNDNYQSTGDLARKLGISSNEVSSLLRNLENTSGLLDIMKDGKLKHWRKKYS